MTYEKVEEIAREYLALQTRKIHPKGNFVKSGRWHPATEEHCSCCDGIRRPSRAYPFSILNHCRTVNHLLNKHDVQDNQTRKQIKHAIKAYKEGLLK